MPLSKLAGATALVVAFAAALPASAELVHKTSPHSVTETLDRLEAAVTGAGATVFARVDHAKGAASVGADLRPTQMLMFGNPKLGTPAILADQAAGLDLPLRVVAYADAEGVVHVVYHAPDALAQTHAIPADADVLAKMTGALNKLTDAAVAE